MVLVVVVGATLLICTQGRSRRKLEAYKQRLRAQGEKLEVGEHVPAAPEGSYAAAQSFMSLVSVTGRLSNAPPVMKMIVPGHALIAWQQDALPSWDVRQTNIWPGLLVELAANRGALSNLESVLNGPVLCFNLNYSQGFALLLPHLAPLRQAEVLASAAAMSSLHQHDYAGAWKNLRMTVGLVRHYRPEPVIISHLVHVGMANIAIDTTWEFLQSDQWTDAQLADLQTNWEALEFFDSAEPAFAMERATDIGTFGVLRKSYNEMTNTLGSGSGSAGLFNDPVELAKDVAERWHYRLWQHSWSFDEESYFIEMSTAGLRAIRSTELTGTYFPVLRGLNAEIDRINKIHTNDIGHFLLGPMLSREDWISTSVAKFANAEVARRLVVTAIALKRYRLRHGKYPADLSALVPEFCKQLPADFMDGKPMRYKPTPDGNYLLYSVGEDGEDNGGDLMPAKSESGPIQVADWRAVYSWLKGRDIVWPQPATAEQVSEYYKEQAGKFARVPQPPVVRPVPANAPATNLSRSASSNAPSGQTNVSTGTHTNGK